MNSTPGCLQAWQRQLGESAEIRDATEPAIGMGRCRAAAACRRGSTAATQQAERCRSQLPLSSCSGSISSRHTSPAWQASHAQPATAACRPCGRNSSGSRCSGSSSPSQRRPSSQAGSGGGMAGHCWQLHPQPASDPADIEEQEVRQHAGAGALLAAVPIGVSQHGHVGARAQWRCCPFHSLPCAACAACLSPLSPRSSSATWSVWPTM